MHEICSNVQYYAGICTNEQNKNMQNMCILSINMLKCAKTKCAHVCKYTICINMHKICTNILKYAKQNMHKYAYSKYT